MSTFKDAQLHYRDYANAADTNIGGIIMGTFTLDPGSVTNATSAEQSVTIRGLSTNDMIFLNVPASLETGLALSGMRISAADTLQVRLSCVAAAPVDGASRVWQYLQIRNVVR